MMPVVPVRAVVGDELEVPAAAAASPAAAAPGRRVAVASRARAREHGVRPAVDERGRGVLGGRGQASVQPSRASPSNHPAERLAVVIRLAAAAVASVENARAATVTRHHPTTP
eukprot:31235-Pelagococcus_subviridis.AAC.12